MLAIARVGSMDFFVVGNRMRQTTHDKDYSVLVPQSCFDLNTGHNYRARKNNS